MTITIDLVSLGISFCAGIFAMLKGMPLRMGDAEKISKRSLGLVILIGHLFYREFTIWIGPAFSLILDTPPSNSPIYHLSRSHYHLGYATFPLVNFPY